MKLKLASLSGDKTTGESTYLPEIVTWLLG